MPLTRHSKIKDAWAHPVGHALLQNFLRGSGKNELFLTNPFVANAPLQSLDRMAGPGFCDMLLEMAVHGPEHPSAPAAQTPAWWKDAILYHIFLPGFMDSDHDGMGDIGGVTQRLPYVSKLGVTALWLWPLASGAEAGSFPPPSALGKQEKTAFTGLLSQAHQRNLRVVLGLDSAGTPALSPCFKPTLPREAPYQHGELATTLQQWAKMGVDGFFLGPVESLGKSSHEDPCPALEAAFGTAGCNLFAHSPRLHHSLRELRAALPPPLLLVAEVPGAGPELAKLFTAKERAELDMVLDAGHLVARGRPVRGEDPHLEPADLKQHYLKWAARYGAEHWMPLFLESSHTPRIVSRLGAGSLYRAILAKMLGMMLLTLRGTPVLYQGQELGLPNTRFPSIEELHDAAAAAHYAELCEKMDAAAAFQKLLATTHAHAHAPMPWAAGPGAGFTGAVPYMRLPDGADFLNAATQMEDKNSVWRFYQRLLALRKASPCLVHGSFNPVFSKNRRVFCYFRILDGEKWYVEMNLTERQVPRPGRILRSQKLELSNYDLPARALRAYEANLYRCE